MSVFIRTYAKLEIRKRCKEILPGVPRVLPEEYEEQGPNAPEWYYPWFGADDPLTMGGANNKRRWFDLEVRVNVFTRFARDRPDLDLVAVDRLSDLVCSGLSGWSANILDRDSASPHNIQGNLLFSEARKEPIPENPRTPGVIGLSCVFVVRVQNVGLSR